MKKKRMGRGLSALIPENTTSTIDEVIRNEGTLRELRLEDTNENRSASH